MFSDLVIRIFEQIYLQCGDWPRDAMHTRGLCLGTNLIHDFTAVTFSVKLAFFREKRPFFVFP